MSETDFVAAFSKFSSTAAWSPASSHIPLGDSKKLYRSSRSKSGGGLRSLEAGLLTMLRTLGQTPGNVGLLIDQVDGRAKDFDALPWYSHLGELPIPSTEAIHADRIAKLADRASTALDETGIQLVAIRASVMIEPEFNRQVESLGSKGRLLSNASFELASRLLSGAVFQRAEIFFDRQGGRKNYLPLLLDWMPDSWFVERDISPARCSYGSTTIPEMQIHFTVGGDNFPATALASMVAKYLRERLMESFNRYWSQHCPGLKPTAGYPVDALRFRDEVRRAAPPQSFPEESWWRCK